MTQKEKDMAVLLLDMASDSFANHGCNDFDLRQFGFTVPEMRKMVRDYHKWNGDPEQAASYSDKDLPFAMPDHVAFTWLRLKIAGELP